MRLNGCFLHLCFPGHRIIAPSIAAANEAMKMAILAAGKWSSRKVSEAMKIDIVKPIPEIAPAPSNDPADPGDLTQMFTSDITESEY